MKITLLAGLALVLASLAAAQTPGDIKGLAPVSVSSANYRETPRDELLQLVNHPNALNPETRPLAPLAAPKYFVFIPGEIFPADLNYEHVCGLLTASLAKKNYLNAADPRGVIREPAKVTLMLRVNYGVSLWRLPVVRTDHVEWGEGLVGKVHDSLSLTHHGGTRTWDSRAGGDDNSLSVYGQNENSTQTVWGGGGGGTATQPTTVFAPSASGTTAQNAYEGTREFNLIVVDAFDYGELRTKGKSAKCLWTTFVAVPVQRGQKFSAALATMLKAAAPFWGDTTAGIQVYNDARAEVKLGEITEVKDDPADRK